MTPAQIEDAARFRMNATGSTFWSSAEIIQNYLYFSCMELATETRCIENRYTTTSVASQTEYAAASLALEIKRVEYNGRGLQLISFDQYNVMTAAGTTVTGTPVYYYHFDEVIGLHPTPSTASVTIKIYTYDFHDAVTSASTLTIPTEYHTMLVSGVVAKMVTKELGHPMQAVYTREWAEAKARVLQRENWRKWRSSSKSTSREEDLLTTQFGMIQ